jgi:hypothetical protein
MRLSFISFLMVLRPVRQNLGMIKQHQKIQVKRYISCSRRCKRIRWRSCLPRDNMKVHLSNDQSTGCRSLPKRVLCYDDVGQLLIDRECI